MQLAKPCLDVGVFTTALEPMLAFYRDTVRLPYEELLPLGGGAQQHRHGMNGSVFKLNHSRDALPDAPASGYRRLTIARADCGAPTELRDPDGTTLRLVPPGYDEINTIGIDIAVRDLAGHRRFWQDAMGAAPLGDDRFRLGTTLIALRADAMASQNVDLRGRGLRYLTVQVFDVVAEHAALVAAGVSEGRAPSVVGTVARISFIRDPDGNWIEISQRKSLTGSID